MRNSYLSGLPEAESDSSRNESILKLMHYWEKNILPPTISFCKGTYQAWQFKFYFEQVRHYLRRNDAANAITDLMVMLDQKVPQGMVIPDESHDWSFKIIDECICEQFLLAKITADFTSSLP